MKHLNTGQIWHRDEDITCLHDKNIYFSRSNILNEREREKKLRSYKHAQLARGYISSLYYASFIIRNASLRPAIVFRRMCASDASIVCPTFFSFTFFFISFRLMCFSFAVSLSLSRSIHAIKNSTLHLFGASRFKISRCSNRLVYLVRVIEDEFIVQTHGLWLNFKIQFVSLCRAGFIKIRRSRIENKLNIRI